MLIALFISGNTGPTKVANVESYNGTSWSETGDLNTGRDNLAGLMGPSASTSAIGAGGYTAPAVFQAVTEQWDGTSWTEVGDLATGRSELAGTSAATTTAGLVTGGKSPGLATATEEWTDPVYAVKTVTVS